MALQSSGAISLNEIHIEAGGTTGTSASINDADIRALIGKSSGATMSFSEWYGASASYAHETRGIGFTSTSNASITYGFVENDANNIWYRLEPTNEANKDYQVFVVDYTDGSKTNIGSRLNVYNGQINIAATNDGGCLVYGMTGNPISTDASATNGGRFNSGQFNLEKWSSTGTLSWRRKVNSASVTTASDGWGSSGSMYLLVDGDDAYFSYSQFKGQYLNDVGFDEFYFAKINHTNGNVSWKRTFIDGSKFTDINTYQQNNEHPRSSLTMFSIPNTIWSSYNDYIFMRFFSASAIGGGFAYKHLLMKKSDGQWAGSTVSNSYNSAVGGLSRLAITAAPSGWGTATNSTRYYNGSNYIDVLISQETGKLAFGIRKLIYYNGNYGGYQTKGGPSFLADTANAAHFWGFGLYDGTYITQSYGNMGATSNNTAWTSDFAFEYGARDLTGYSNYSADGRLGVSYPYLNIRNYQASDLGSYSDKEYVAYGHWFNRVSTYSDHAFWFVDKDTLKGNVSLTSNAVNFLPSSTNKILSAQPRTSSNVFSEGALPSGYTVGTTTTATVTSGITNLSGAFTSDPNDSAYTSGFTTTSTALLSAAQTGSSFNPTITSLTSSRDYIK